MEEVTSEIFDESYWQEFSGGFVYNVIRPVRRHLSLHPLLLPEWATLTSFAFDTGERLLQYRKKFSVVYGYDINPASIEDARRKGFDGYAWKRDVTADNLALCSPRTTLCSCYYLFEHLTDTQVLAVIKNMIRVSGINLIQLTTMDDEHFIKDPTHNNPKNTSEWGVLLNSFYKPFGWKLWTRAPQSWCFASPQEYKRLRWIKDGIELTINHAWRGTSVLDRIRSRKNVR